MKRSLLQATVLLPIPIIAALVVWAGQRVPPQPQLPVGGSSGAPAAAQVTMPATLPSGWKLQGSAVRYDEKTLFDRIDGAAPVYIRAGFVYSLGGEYRKDGVKEPITFDVYDMGNGRQGLGMYATERDAGYRFISVGDEAYLASGTLNFWRGRFYVKLAGYEPGDETDRQLTEVASGIIAALPAAPEVVRELAVLRQLPPGRLPHSDGYAHAPLGEVDGVAGAFHAEYQDAETRYRLFVVREATPQAAAARFERVKAYFQKQKDRGKAEEAREGAARVLTVRGESSAALVVLAGASLGGSVELPEVRLVEPVRSALLKSLAAPPPPEEKKR